MTRIAVLTTTSSQYAHHLLEGISTYAREAANWHFVIGNIFTNGMSILTESMPDAVIAMVPNAEAARNLIRLKLPIVNCSGNAPGQSLVTVRVDNHQIGRMAADYFLAKGFQSFAYCGRAQRVPLIERGAAFQETVGRASHACSVFLKWPVPAGPDNEHWILPSSLPDLDDWIRSLPKPVAMLACDDTVAVQLIESCARLNITIPNEVALLGVNNETPICQMTRPSLSSIALPVFQVGYEAAAVLHQLMEGKPVEQERLFPPIEVVARESTDSTAVTDPLVLDAIRFIRRCIAEPIMVDDVVEELAISRRLLEMRFRNVLHRTIHQEIQRTRIERVRELLRETNWSMERIAKASGFAGRERLSVVFRQYTDETPASYRRRCQRRR